MAGRISLEAQKYAGALAGERIPAPKGLTKAEVAIWDTLVVEKPPEWFTRDNVELLKLYCRCAAQMDWLADRIEIAKSALEYAEEQDDLESMGSAVLLMMKFQQMEDKYSKNLMNAATKLRMTPQAQILAQTAGTKAKNSSPTKSTWETKEEEGTDLYAEIPDEGGMVQ